MSAEEPGLTPDSLSPSDRASASTRPDSAVERSELDGTPTTLFHEADSDAPLDGYDLEAAEAVLRAFYGRVEGPAGGTAAEAAPVDRVEGGEQPIGGTTVGLAASAAAAGERIPESWRYVRRQPPLARSRMSIVWSAYDRVLEREIALKQPTGEMAGEEFKARFNNEARITSRLRHPAIVPVHDLCETGPDAPFYTMPLIGGRTFKQAAIDLRERPESEGKRIQLRVLLGAFITLCRGIAYAHSKGVIHRDLKGSNAMIGEFGEVLILDWGLAKELALAEEAPAGPPPSTSGSSHEATARGTAMGTWPYMPPEQARDATLADRRSDVFGLGAVLHEILTAEPPFPEAKGSESYFAGWAKGEPAPVRVIPDTPAALDAVCAKALKREPGDRYESAADLADEVERWLADQPVLALREPIAARAARWARGHRPLVASAGIVLVVTTVLLAVSTVLLARSGMREAASAAEARHSLRGSINAIQRLLEIATEHLADVPGRTAARIEIVEQTSPFIEALRRRGPFDPIVEWTAYRLLREQAELARLDGYLDGAVGVNGLTIELLEEWGRRDAASARYIRGQVAWRRVEQSELLRLLGRLDEAQSEVDRALAATEGSEADDLLKEEGVRSRLRALAAGAQGEILGMKGEADEADRWFAESLDLWRPLVERVGEPGGNPADLAWAIEAATRRAALLARTGHGEEAAGLVAEADGWRRRIDRVEAATPTVRATSVNLDLVGLELGTRAEGEAESILSAARSLAGDFPERADYRMLLGRALIAVTLAGVDSGSASGVEETRGIFRDVLGRSRNHVVRMGDAGRALRAWATARIEADPATVGEVLEESSMYLNDAIARCSSCEADRALLELNRAELRRVGAEPAR